MTGLTAGLVLNHLWQSTLCAVAILLLTLLFRRDRAHVRHALLCAASAKFLVPFALLRWIGTQLPVPPAPHASLPLGTQIVAAPFSPVEFTAFPAALGSAAVAPALAPHVPLLLVTLWALGTAVVLMTWIRGWRTLVRLRRAGRSLGGSRETMLLRRVEQRTGARRALPIVFIDAPLEPGVFGVWRPVLLWPTDIGRRLTDEQIEAIFAHEVCHVRRRDTLTAVVHTFVESVFWFHPLVWWIGHRMVAEREQACDEDVLRRGSDPRLYAESILRLCECLLEDQRACAAAATGADLKKRIERIMTERRGTALGWPAQALLVALAVCALAIPVVAGTLVPGGIGYGGIFFQVPRLTTAFAPRAHIDPVVASRTRFVSVRVTRAGVREPAGTIIPLAAGRLRAPAVTVRQLVRYVYASERPALDALVVDLPAWANTDRFTISAVAPRPFVNDESGEPQELLAMLRHLLEDRFRFSAHVETRQLPIYALVRTGVAPGPGLVPTASTCWRPPDGAPPPGVRPDMSHVCRTALTAARGSFWAEGLSMRRFATMLANQREVRRVVVDETDLGGAFDVTLAWGASSRDASAPDTLFTALPRQLGLALESRVGSVDVLVVDHVERPTTD